MSTCSMPTARLPCSTLFNQIKLAGGQLLTAATQPPAHLALREDLRTRLGSGLIYRLQPLTDAEKAEAIAAQAK